MIRLGVMLCLVAIPGSFVLSARGSPTSPTESKLAAMTPEGGEALSAAASLQLIEDGRRLYDRRCGACHSLDHNRVGPKHRGVYGREAGAVVNFRYTSALRDSGVVWTEETLDAWLENPTLVVPGTSMGFRLNSAEERRAIIAYLKSVSGENDE